MFPSFSDLFISFQNHKFSSVWQYDSSVSDTFEFVVFQDSDTDVQAPDIICFGQLPVRVTSYNTVLREKRLPATIIRRK